MVLLHRAAMGGAERIAALAAFRATGEVEAGGRRVRFTLLAARPARVRLETVADGRTLVQATDGRSPPWEMDSGAPVPRAAVLAPAAARAFVAEAEFDDPLVAEPSRGFALDAAGFADAGGEKYPRLLVTRIGAEPFHLVLNPVTYLIEQRIERRAAATGRRFEVVTRYFDFRPVAGVLLPHGMEVKTDGRVSQRTQIDQIVPVPAPDEALFRLPQTPEKL